MACAARAAARLCGKGVVFAMDKYALLKQHFGHNAFRPGQEMLIDALLERETLSRAEFEAVMRGDALPPVEEKKPEAPIPEEAPEQAQESPEAPEKPWEHADGTADDDTEPFVEPDEK